MKTPSTHTSPSEQAMRELAAAFFARSTTYQAVTLEEFALFAGVDVADIQEIFPLNEWTSLRNAWRVQYLRPFMDEVYREAHPQHRYQSWCPHIPSLPLPERGMAGAQSNTSNGAGEAARSDQDDDTGERPTG